MIYVDFESIIVLEDNEKQNPKESYTNKYQKHIACSYGYKIVCVDDKYINSMIEENKPASDMIKKHFKKEQVITKEDKEDLKTLLNFEIT